jgi:hypothetical protein
VHRYERFVGVRQAKDLGETRPDGPIKGIYVLEHLVNTAVDFRRGWYTVARDKFE